MSDNQLPSRFVRGYRHVKRFVIAVAIGSALTTFGAWTYVGQTLAQVRTHIAQGLCPNTDIDQTIYWIKCQDIDSYIATNLPLEETADPIGDIIRKAEAKSRGRK